MLCISVSESIVIPIGPTKYAAVCSWMDMNEFQNKESDVLNALVWRGEEVFAHVCIQFGVCDLGKVFTRLPFSLTHTLVSTPGALDPVYQIGTLAGYISLCGVRPSRGL